MRDRKFIETRALVLRREDGLFWGGVFWARELRNARFYDAQTADLETVRRFALLLTASCGMRVELIQAPLEGQKGLATETPSLSFDKGRTPSHKKGLGKWNYRNRRRKK